MEFIIFTAWPLLFIISNIGIFFSDSLQVLLASAVVIILTITLPLYALAAIDKAWASGGTVSELLPLSGLFLSALFTTVIIACKRGKYRSTTKGN